MKRADSSVHGSQGARRERGGGAVRLIGTETRAPRGRAQGHGARAQDRGATTGDPPFRGPGPYSVP